MCIKMHYSHMINKDSYTLSISLNYPHSILKDMRGYTCCHIGKRYSDLLNKKYNWSIHFHKSSMDIYTQFQSQ